MTSGARDPLLDFVGLAAADLLAILDMASGTDITELEITIDKTRLSLRRPPLVADAAGEVDHGVAGSRSESSPLAITSPLVGIFRPSVASGEPVQTGQSIGKIEALGMPTSVEAPHSGTVDEVLVSDGSPVEFGQPLLTLRRASHAP